MGAGVPMSGSREKRGQDLHPGTERSNPGPPRFLQERCKSRPSSREEERLSTANAPRTPRPTRAGRQKAHRSTHLPQRETAPAAALLPWYLKSVGSSKLLEKEGCS